MQLHYDPLNKQNKDITGAVKINIPITFTVYTDAASVCLMLKKEGDNEQLVGYEMTPVNGGFSYTLKITTVGLYRYYFNADGKSFYADESLKACENCGQEWILVAYEDKYQSPDWLKGGLFYQIFPDRFAIGGERKKTKDCMIYRDDWGGVPTYKPNKDGIVENRDMFGGNFDGICEKLDYLQSLGVTCIYLNPVFESFSNHKYDTANYGKTDSDFGSLKDLSNLISKAEQKGIKIILDGVFSHTGADSVYFNKYGRYDEAGAYNSENSPYYDWYTFESFPDVYECWWGIKILPNVNENTPSFNQYINGEDGIIRRYINMGIAGFRLDVADELPDEFLFNLAKAAKSEKNDALVLGEVWENAATKYAYGKLRPYLFGAQLDSVTNYPLKNAILDFVKNADAHAIDNVMRELINAYPARTLNVLMNVIDTHDTPRAITVFGNYDRSDTKDDRAVAKLLDYDAAKSKLKIAAILQYFLPGVPCLYYGDESGLEGFEDPFNRKCYPWNNEDKELIDFYKRLGKIRREYSDVLSDGEYISKENKKGVFGFYRICGDKKIAIYVNAGTTEYVFSEINYDLLTNCHKKSLEPGTGIIFCVLKN